MITLSQIRAWCIIAIGIVVSLYAAVRIGNEGVAGFSTLLAGGLAVAWITFGGAVWWLPLFFGMGVGGMFYFGFKLYPYEVGFLLALAASLPLAMMRSQLPSGRRRLPGLLPLFLVFILLHAAASCAQFGGGGFRGVGSILRIYLREFWGPCFVLMFYFYGQSRRIALGFYVLEATYLMRLIFGVIAFFYPNFTYVPGLNLILPGSGMDGSVDLRYSGGGLATLALVFALCRKSWLHSMVQSTLFLVGMTALTLGGGRTTIVSMVMALFFFAIFSRRRMVLSLMALGFFVVFAAVNLEPEFLNTLHPRVQRAASILILQQEGREKLESGEAQALEGEMTTNDWHRQLDRIGWERWTKGPRNFIFGTGIRPFSEDFLKESDPKVKFQLNLEAAADTNAYENGLWSVLAGTGTVMMLLYVGLFWQMGREIWRLYPIAAKTSFGLPLVFFTTYLVVSWFLLCYWRGDFPSAELMVTGLTTFYLQDREAEFKEEEKT